MMSYRSQFVGEAASAVRADFSAMQTQRLANTLGLIKQRLIDSNAWFTQDRL
jgi:hypothetical protein